MSNPTINKIIIEKTNHGINLEFLLTDGTTHIHTDLDSVTVDCINSKDFLSSFHASINNDIKKNDQIMKSIVKLLDK